MDMKLSLSLAALLTLSACASNGNGTATGSHAGDKAAMGAVIGGGGAYLGCKLLGGSNVACRNLAVVGASAGGYISWKQGKEQDLAEAQAFADKMRKSKVPVQTDTGTVRHQDDKGQPVAYTAWRGTNVGLPPKALAAGDPDLQHSVELAGQLAVSRHEPTTVIVSVPAKQRENVLFWLNNGFQQGTAANDTTPPKIQEVPYKKGSLPYLRVQPTDQQQFHA